MKHPDGAGTLADKRGYIVTAYIVTAYLVMAYLVMAYTVMTYTVMAHIVMACIVMAKIVMGGSPKKNPPFEDTALVSCGAHRRHRNGHNYIGRHVFFCP